MSPLTILLITFYINFLMTWTNCFNLSSVDKDDLCHLLLNRQISSNDSNALHLVSPPPFHYDNVPENDDVVNAVASNDKVNEFSYDIVDGGVDDDEVKVDFNDRDESYENQNKTIDNNLKSQFMDIFNVSVIDVNKTADTVQHNTSDGVFNIRNNELNSNDDLSDAPDINENLKSKRQEYPSVTPSVIAIDVYKPSETEFDDDDDISKLKVHTRPKPGQTSLVIVFDGTGSMENCLIQLRAGAKQIIDKFANRDDNPIYNYIFVPFRDPRKDLAFDLI